MRAEFCVMVSNTWLAKNIIAVSMIANRSAKKIGATIANSNAADARRLRRKRLSNVRNDAGGVGDDIGSSNFRATINSSERNSRNSLAKCFSRWEPNGTNV